MFAVRNTPQMTHCNLGPGQLSLGNVYTRDFAGPIQGTMLFVLVDAHSKWPEVYPMTTTTSGDTIEVLWKIFSSRGWST